MELKGFDECPPMLEGVKPSRRHDCAKGDLFGWNLLHPDPVSLKVEGRNDRVGDRPGARMAPDQACAPWAKEPLVGSGDEEVAAEILHRDVFDAKPMDPIHAEEHPVTLVPASIELRQRFGHLADRELEAS